MGKTYDGCNWFAADTFILGGRSKWSRRWSKTRELRYTGEADEDGRRDIALQLHATDVVTYHVDGTQTIYLGGWNTVTTKRTINAFSVANIGSLTPKMSRIWDGCSLGVYHSDDPLSQPRIQKCRECHGVKILRHWCDGRGYQSYLYGTEMMARDRVWAALPGHTWRTIREPTEWEIDWRERRLLYHNTQWTEDGTMVIETHKRERPYNGRSLIPCYHGQLEPHTWEAPCARCDGEGRVDFGSQPVPWGFDAHDAITVDATGRVITEEDRISAARSGLVALRRRMRRRAS